MPLARFSPPANLNDFLPAQLDEWSAAVSGWTDTLIEELVQRLTESQLFNATKVDPPDPVLRQAIVWNGFPKSLRMRYGRPEALRKAEDLEEITGYYKTLTAKLYQRRQDEYLEWRTVINGVSGKVEKIVFTVEPPEYWSALKGDTLKGFADEDFDFSDNANKVLELYRQFVSDQVVMEDLLFPDDWCRVIKGVETVIYRKGEYNPYNKWNTSHGIMHLTHVNNSLKAELLLAADAMVLYKDERGQPVLRPDELICCSGYGDTNRASDPTIGGSVNQLARLGGYLAVDNPVGLYIDSVNLTGVLEPDGTPVGLDYWTVQRGDVARGLVSRAVFAVPDGKAFTLSDLTIGGEPLRYGGQIAERITIKLIGISGGSGEVVTAPVQCACHCCIDLDRSSMLRLVDFETHCGADSVEAFLHGQGGDYTAVQAAAPAEADAGAPIPAEAEATGRREAPPGQSLRASRFHGIPHMSRRPEMLEPQVPPTPPEPPAPTPSVQPTPGRPGPGVRPGAQPAGKR